MPPLTLVEIPPTLLRVFAVVFGLLWGSFLNVVIYRLPRDMNLSKPASHCPACQTPIKPYRNIPVLSWLLMRGRAPCCGVKVPVRYLLVELVGGVLSLAVFEALILPLPPESTAIFALAIYLSYFALALGLTAAAFIDVEHMIVPDSISLGGTALGIVTFAFRDMSLVESLIGAAAGFAVVWLPLIVGYEKLRGKPGMGLGDAKLVMLAGAWFGWEGALLVLGAGAIQGSVATILLMLSGKGLEEPEAVKEERAQWQAEMEQMSPEERAAFEKELAKDPLAQEAEEGLAQARIAFGPFLILATLECMLLSPATVVGWLLGA